MVVVPDRHAHVSLRAPVRIGAESTEITYFLESAVSLVVVDVVGLRIVGHHQIQPAVVIKIHPTHGKAVVELLVDNARLPGNVSEGTVSVVSEQKVRGALHAQWSAGNPHTEKRAKRLPGIVGRSAHAAAIVAPRPRRGVGCRTERGPISAHRVFTRLTGRRRIFPIEFDVAGHIKVQAPIAVVISEGAAGRPQIHLHPRSRGDIGEAPVAVVTVQTALSQVDDINIRPTVIVEIAGAYPRAPAVVLDASAGGDIGERTVAVVAKQGGRQRLFLTSSSGVSQRIDEVDIDPSIVIEIEESQSGARGFRQVGFERLPRDMLKPTQAGGLGHIFVVHSLHRLPSRGWNSARQDFRLGGGIRRSCNQGNRKTQQNGGEAAALPHRRGVTLYHRHSRKPDLRTRACDNRQHRGQKVIHERHDGSTRRGAEPS